MYNKTLLSLGLTAIILLASCNGNKENNASDAALPDSSQTATKTTKTDDAPEKANINVTITGGDLDGSYSAVCRDGCCSWGIAGEKIFGNQYSETGKGPKELSSVQLIVDDVKDNKSTKEFTLTVSFGELFSDKGKSFNINTRQGKTDGSGTLDLQYSGNKAVVTIKGVSKEGPAIDLKMECSNVMSPTNMGL